MRNIRCRNCGALAEVPDYHGALLVVCKQCEWQETHPPRRPIAKSMDGQANAAFLAHEERLRAAGKRLERAQSLSPRSFVRFCAELFEQADYEALPSDHEAYAFELRRGEEVVYVACEQRSADHTIKLEDLKPLAGALEHDKVDRGVFVTLGTFAEPCERAATRADIELVDGAALRLKVAFADTDRLDQWLDEHSA